MVEIQEETSESGNNGAGASSSSRGPTNTSTAPAISISQFVTENTMSCCQLACRVATLLFALSYLVPVISPFAPETTYYKAFAAAAATNALRMQQRVGPVALNREFFARLMLEDSCHYLFYCILFLVSSPITMALLPIVLFATLHSASYIVKILEATGKAQGSLAIRMRALIAQHTANLLGVVACAEIFLVPILISMIFVGQASLFVPFVYYRFLTLRYASRRNPYTRDAFAQMRLSLQQVAASSRCPQPIRMLIDKSISVISSLAPAFV